jgi:phosphohistidine phosphatase
MRVHLCRHAEAAPGEPDALRTLTAAGVAQAHALGARLRSSEAPPTVVLTSPLLRARQTAEAIGRELDVPVLADTRLAPGATAASLAEALVGLVGPVAAVGHQPDCSHIAVELTGSDPGFPVAGSAELDVVVDAGAAFEDGAL